MACCRWTNTLVHGQLLQRMGLDTFGSYDPPNSKDTCRNVTIVWIVFVGLGLIGVGYLAWPFFFVWILLIGIRLRGAVRRKFDIPTQNCHCFDGAMEDCCCMLFCNCCSIIQLARQTHNEQKYPYNFSDESGLPMYAPVIYEQPDNSQQQQPQFASTNAGGAPIIDKEDPNAGTLVPAKQL